MTAPEVRLHLYFATTNDSALILRRAEKKLFNLIAWDRATDTFTEGQGIRKSIRPEQCALSPDGAHFLYAVQYANPHTPAGENYTVLSRVPWFTALALHPNVSAWDSGGTFLDDTLYQLNDNRPSKDIVGRAEGLQAVVNGEKTKDCRTGLRLTNGQPAPLSRALLDRLLVGAPPLQPVTEEYETEGGLLCRRGAAGRQLIRDFTTIAPRFEPAPYSMPKEAPERSPWHPLDAEGNQ